MATAQEMPDILSPEFAETGPDTPRTEGRPAVTGAGGAFGARLGTTGPVPGEQPNATAGSGRSAPAQPKSQRSRPASPQAWGGVSHP